MNLNKSLSIERHLTADELVSRLKFLFESLENRDIGNTDRRCIALSTRLSQKWLRKHDSQPVRLLVIGCCARLIAIFGNRRLRYHGIRLRGFLEFIIDELSEMKNPESDSSLNDLIEMLFELETFLTASEESFYSDICCSLVQTLFRAFRELESDELSCLSLIDLINQVIGGCSDVPQLLLDIIFINMIKPNKTINPAAYSMSVRLIDENKNVLERKMISFFSNCLVGLTTESQLSSRVYSLLREVVNIAPEVLIDVLPKLRFRLQADTPNERAMAVQFVGYLFLKFSFRLIKEQLLLWSFFLDRFADVSSSVRLACVLSSTDLIIYNPELMTRSPDGPALIEHLEARSCDVDAEVRLAVVKVILKVMKCRPWISDDLFRSLLKRTSDNDFEVREAALIGLGRLFDRICEDLESITSNIDTRRVPNEHLSLVSRVVEAEDLGSVRDLEAIDLSELNESSSKTCRLQKEKCSERAERQEIHPTGNVSGKEIHSAPMIQDLEDVDEGGAGLEAKEAASDDSETTRIYNYEECVSLSGIPARESSNDEEAESSDAEYESFLLSRARTIANFILCSYRNQSLSDRTLIENVLNILLVPYSLKFHERIQRILFIYSLLDKHGTSYFQAILKSRQLKRVQLRNILTFDLEMTSEIDDANDSERNLSGSTSQRRNKTSLLMEKIPDAFRSSIREFSKSFPQPPVSVKRILELLQFPEIRQDLTVLLNEDCSCDEANELMQNILKKCRSLKISGDLLQTIRLLLQQTSSVMVDMEAVVVLTGLWRSSDSGGNILGIRESSGLEHLVNLLQSLSLVNRDWFQAVEIYESLLQMLRTQDPTTLTICLEIFSNICQPWLEHCYPEIYRRLMKGLIRVMKIGTQEQMKRAVRCMRSCGVETARQQALKLIEHHLRSNWNVESQMLLTAVAAVRLLLKLLAVQLMPEMREKILNLVMNELLSSKKQTILPSTIKIEAMKTVVALLLLSSGEGDNILAEQFLVLIEHSLRSAVKDTSIRMSRRKKIGKAAASCLIRLAGDPFYDRMITLDQFDLLAQLFVDRVDEIHETILRKLQKGLWTFRLSSQYLAIFSLAPVVLFPTESVNRRTSTVSYLVQRNVDHRRDYARNFLTEKHSRKFPFVLPDYSIVFVVRLLACVPQFGDYHDASTQQIMKKCLSVIVKPLASGVNLPSFLTFHERLLRQMKRRSKHAQHVEDSFTDKICAVADVALMVLKQECDGQMLLDKTELLKFFLPLKPSLPTKLVLHLVTDQQSKLLPDVRVERTDKSLDVMPNDDEPVVVEEDDLREKQTEELLEKSIQLRQKAREENENRLRFCEDRRLSKITDYFKVVARIRRSDGDNADNEAEKVSM